MTRQEAEHPLVTRREHHQASGKDRRFLGNDWGQHYLPLKSLGWAVQGPGLAVMSKMEAL